MTKIDVDIQNGFLLRRGYRGRYVTFYSHRYGGKREETERYHAHPWILGISIVLRGGFQDDIQGQGVRWRRPLSISFYYPSLQHRIGEALPGTRSIFFGFFRTQKPLPSATEKCKEGYCHYTEQENSLWGKT